MAANFSTISKSWFSPEGYIYFRQDVADAPCKDYFQLVVLHDLSVSFKVWKITPPFKSTSNLAPIGFQSTFEHFRTDLSIRDAIQGKLRGELEFLDNLLEGRFNFLERLETNLQLYIISFLDVCSVLRLRATSTHFKQLCDDNSIWKRHFMSSSLRYYVTPGLMEIVDQQGWKAFYMIMNRVANSTDEIGTRFLLQKIPTGYQDSKNTSRRGSNPTGYPDSKNVSRRSSNPTGYPDSKNVSRRSSNRTDYPDDKSASKRGNSAGGTPLNQRKTSV